MRGVWLLLIPILLLSVGTGKAELDLLALGDARQSMLLYQLRIPRTLLAFFSGSLLGVAGLLFQTLFRNALTTPFTLGVSSGATLGAAFAIKLGLFGSLLGISAVSLFGFGGAVVSIGVLLLFAKRLHSAQSSSLLLVGIALSFFYSAALMILYYLSDMSQSYAITRFTMGSLSIVGYSEVLGVIAATLILLFVALFYRRELLLLSVSLTHAHSKGVDAKRVQTLLFLVVSLAIGVGVSVTGPIGFVGLIIPHLMRRLLALRTDRLLLPVFVASGLFLTLCDTASRLMPTPSEVPIGVVTALFGAPFFIYLILTKGHQ